MYLKMICLCLLVLYIHLCQHMSYQLILYDLLIFFILTPHSWTPSIMLLLIVLISKHVIVFYHSCELLNILLQCTLLYCIHCVGCLRFMQTLTLYRALYKINYIYFFQHWNLILDIKMVKIKNKKFVWGAQKKLGGRCTRSCTLHHNGSVW